MLMIGLMALMIGCSKPTVKAPTSSIAIREPIPTYTIYEFYEIIDLFRVLEEPYIIEHNLLWLGLDSGVVIWDSRDYRNDLFLEKYESIR